MSAIAKYATDLPEGHPVKAYLEENALVRTLVQQIIEVDVSNDFEHFSAIFNQLARIEKHFTRKENQLSLILKNMAGRGLVKTWSHFMIKLEPTSMPLENVLRAKTISI